MGLGALNLVSLLLFVIAFVLVGAWPRPRPAPLPQLSSSSWRRSCWSTKVWSPQYVIWLAPLAVLARPRLGSYLVWQAAEVGYFFAIWAYLIT